MIRRVGSRGFSTVFKAEDIRHRIQMFKQQRDEVIDVIQFTYPPFLKQVNARQLQQHIKTNSIPTNITILHSLAHIEFNAFSSYVDTYFRFAKTSSKEIPAERINQFAQDTAKVALEQAKHFQALISRLEGLGNPYGSIPVITGLTKNIEQTSESCLDRVMVISLVQQGKGLDAASRLYHKVASLNDTQSLPILKMIAEQEAGHVGYGVKWFKIMCQNLGFNPKSTFQEILHKRNLRVGNVDKRHRQKAGFPLQWLN